MLEQLLHLGYFIFNWELIQDALSSSRDHCCATQSAIVSLQDLGYIMRG